MVLVLINFLLITFVWVFIIAGTLFALFGEGSFLVVGFAESGEKSCRKCLIHRQKSTLLRIAVPIPIDIICIFLNWFLLIKEPYNRKYTLNLRLDNNQSFNLLLLYVGLIFFQRTWVNNFRLLAFLISILILLPFTNKLKTNQPLFIMFLLLYILLIRVGPIIFSLIHTVVILLVFITLVLPTFYQLLTRWTYVLHFLLVYLNVLLQPWLVNSQWFVYLFLQLHHSVHV